ncbi:MAG: hypothetical protein JW787_12950 [Sedimentisphaerales bacterium]|nr:hypothetical protein [Sedimentisphaerales bacterium]
MKKIYPFFILNLFILLLAGCSAQRQAVEVIVDGNDPFPKNLAGLWRSDNNIWDIYLEPDGRISWAVISLGAVKVVPGRTTTVPMKLGGKGVFKPGLWSVLYLQRQRELSVEISIDYFRTELGKDLIYGKTRDIFTGSVSPDGSLWQAQRYSYPEYTVDTKQYKNYKLPVDSNENPKEILLFRKITASNK